MVATPITVSHRPDPPRRGPALRAPSSSYRRNLTLTTPPRHSHHFWPVQRKSLGKQAQLCNWGASVVLAARDRELARRNMARPSAACLRPASANGYLPRKRPSAARRLSTASPHCCHMLVSAVREPRVSLLIGSRCQTAASTTASRRSLGLRLDIAWAALRRRALLVRRLRLGGVPRRGERAVR